MKSSAYASLPGSSSGRRADPLQHVRRARLRRAIRPASAIEGDQARRFGVEVFHDVRAAPARVQSVQQPRQQDCTGAVDALEMRNVDLDRTAPFKRRSASSTARSTAVAWAKSKAPEGTRYPWAPSRSARMATFIARFISDVLSRIVCSLA